MSKLKPFSHLPGTRCIIPQTTIQVQAFPALLRFTDLATGKTWDEKSGWKGPVDDFTLEHDLQKGHLRVFGKTAEGYRMRQIGDRFKTDQLEQLSLGKHTKLDWELILRRENMEEMVPVLFELGQLVPVTTAQTPILNFLKFSDKIEVAQQLKLFFKTGFHGLMAPRLSDNDFQGIIEEGRSDGSPLALLREGYLAVRALFFTEEDGFSLLPTLPPEFHAGRLLNLRSKEGDIVSLEWSKKLLKKVYIKPAKTREIPLTLQKSLCSFRINQKIKHDVKKPLALIEGKTLFLDRFEK